MAAVLCNAGQPNLGYFRAFQTYWNPKLIRYCHIEFSLTLMTWSLSNTFVENLAQTLYTENGILETELEVASYYSSDKSNRSGPPYLIRFLILPATQAIPNYIL